MLSCTVLHASTHLRFHHQCLWQWWGHEHLPACMFSHNFSKASLILIVDIKLLESEAFRAQVWNSFRIGNWLLYTLYGAYRFFADYFITSAAIDKKKLLSIGGYINSPPNKYIGTAIYLTRAPDRSSMISYYCTTGVNSVCITPVISVTCHWHTYTLQPAWWCTSKQIGYSRQSCINSLPHLVINSFSCSGA